MARLKKGQAPELLNARQKRYRDELHKAGGSRLNCDIGSDANSAMSAIIQRDNCTKRDAVERGLILLASPLGLSAPD